MTRIMLRKAAIAVGLLYVFLSRDYVATGIRKRLKRLGLEVIYSVTDRFLTTTR